jgi:hypothetical protein
VLSPNDFALSWKMVPGARIERAPPDFQSGAMTSSATQA